MQEQNSDLFEKLGIDINDDKINIDLGKTKSFFAELQQMLTRKTEKLQKDISEGAVDLSEDVGIKVNDENINIDLGKTKSFIEGLGKQVEGFAKELEASIDKIAKK